MTQTLDRSQHTDGPDTEFGKLLSFPSGEELEIIHDRLNPVVKQLDNIAKVLADEKRRFNFLQHEIRGHNYSADVEVEGILQPARVVFSVPTRSELSDDEGKVDTLLLTQKGDFLMSAAQHATLPRRNRRHDHPLTLNYHFRDTFWEKIELVKIPNEYIPAIESFLDPESTDENFGGNILANAEADIKRHEKNQQKTAR